MKKGICLALACIPGLVFAQDLTPFEQGQGNISATYSQCIAWYQQLSAAKRKIGIKTFGITDAGYPLHVVTYANDGTKDPAEWRRQGKVILLVNNGIHPGEPDGIDASMMLTRDLANGKVRIPDNVGIAFIALYNIGGSLNRGSFSRVNQNGPAEYGFRGNAQNLDLNRDFIKSDSRNARAFAQVFHWADPDLFMDNHVSDGADYQYTMTLLTSQHDKLGGQLGAFLHDRFEPALYSDMSGRGWPMTPYVNFEEGNPDRGWTAYYDPPRYSSGYTTLFHTISFVPETHMLKPYADRVKSTYQLMLSMAAQAGTFSKEILTKRKADTEASEHADSLAVGWKPDNSRYDTISFRGYATGMKTSEVTGLQRMFYDHSKPFQKTVRFYNTFVPAVTVKKPSAYVIPQGWHEVTDLLALNNVRMRRLTRDTVMVLNYYHIDSYQSSARAYEKHHRNSDIRLTLLRDSIRLLKGDWIVPMGQPADRYLVETLEPQGDDSFFSWNFFDAILQQKEGYSAYRWEDVAPGFLREHPEVRQALEEKRRADAAFAASARQQLEFVYQHSPYYEKAHLRYPVYRME